jgi:formiminotetrahydrofolate cyclodeaminase
MRNVITPAMHRAAQPVVLTEAQKKQWEDAQQKLQAEVLGRRQKIEENLAAAFDGLSENRRRFIRMMVALRLPQKAMTVSEMQDWLDEQCIGVARYMQTGRIQ